MGVGEARREGVEKGWEEKEGMANKGGKGV